jgi:hypothetical protein
MTPQLTWDGTRWHCVCGAIAITAPTLADVERLLAMVRALPMAPEGTACRS